MKKKPSVLRFPTPRAAAQPDDRHWHNGGDIEIGFYARTLHRTAKNLIATLDLQPNPKNAWDACPVILLYREAMELHLKALVDEGGNFLKERTDSITLAKTHSQRWLAQIVCQIIKAVKWENEFKCERVANLADFSALVSELEALDPVAVAVRPGTVALMDGCRINCCRQTLCDSQRSWTASWICWMRPPMRWRRSGKKCRAKRSSTPGTTSSRRFSDRA
jgi:hypothetical protein